MLEIAQFVVCAELLTLILHVSTPPAPQELEPAQLFEDLHTQEPQEHVAAAPFELCSRETQAALLLTSRSLGAPCYFHVLAPTMVSFWGVFP